MFLTKNTIVIHSDDNIIELFESLNKEVKFKKEQSTRAELKELLSSPDTDYNGRMADAISKISEIGKSDLAHYVYNRKNVLEALTQLKQQIEQKNFYTHWYKTKFYQGNAV